MTQHLYLNSNRGCADYLPPITSEPKVSHAHFPSLGSMCEYLRQVSKWYIQGEPSELRGALRLATKGWDEGAATASALRDRIAVEHPIAPRPVKWGMSGAIPSVPRALAGNPLAMRTIAPDRARRRPVVTLVTHVGGCAFVPAEAFLNRAAVVAAVVDAIESGGFSCHLVATTYSYAYGRQFAQETAVELKSPGQHVDLSILAFALGHPSMFRGLIFGCYQAEKINIPLGPDLGVTTEYSTSEAAQHIYLLPSLNHTWKDFASADVATGRGLQSTLASLRAQGCPAFGPATESAA